MSDITPILGLPYIAAAQAQKHVTHNEALRGLDVLVQLSVISRALTLAPEAPAEGDSYIVGAPGTGLWADHDDEIAAYRDGAWLFFPPMAGWRAWIGEENLLVVYDGAVWTPACSLSTNPTPLVGINATADETNRLSLNSPASLFNHDGNGHQQKINKNAAGDTASVLFQTAFSGRAEMGTTGDDKFRIKVSPDGVVWHEAIVIDNATGNVTFPNSAGLAGQAASSALPANASREPQNNAPTEALTRNAAGD